MALQVRLTVLAALVVLAWDGSAQAQAPARSGPLRWSKAAPFPEPEEELYGSVVNGKLYVLGGFGIGGNAPGLVYEYDPVADAWRALAPTPVKRCSAIAEAVDGKIYVSGGELQNDRLHATFRALEAYEPATNRWIILPSMPAALHGTLSRSSATGCIP